MKTSLERNERRNKMSKSLTQNAILNVIKTVVSLVFPIVTYPYITRVLGVENLGKFNFAGSIVGYLSLLAGFGITSYAVREGARFKSSPAGMRDFAQQVFSINLLTTLMAYLAMAGILLFSPSMSHYSVLIMIQSIGVLGSVIGAEWINTVYEDFTYITIRTIAFKILAFVLILVFVRSEQDLYIYALIDVASTFGASVCNFIHCRRYVKLKPTKNMKLHTHIKPLFAFLCSHLTLSIYVNSDQTMLGIMCGDYNVGLYSISVKLYSVIKNIIASILSVILPRICSLSGRKYEQERKKLEEKTLKALSFIVIPLAIGMNATAKNIVLLFAGEAYLAGTTSLKILAISAVARSLATFMVNVYAIPRGYEKVWTISTTTSAIVNIVLNFIMIPVWQQNAAAFTTFVSELVVFLILFLYIKPDMDYKRVGKSVFQMLLAGICMIFPVRMIDSLGLSLILRTVLQVLTGAVVYFLGLALMKNEVMVEIISKIKRIVKK